MYDSYIPYREANYVEGVRKPSTQHIDSQALNYWMRALVHRCLSIIKFTLPKDWERAHDFFEYTLLTRGFLAVFNAPEFGISFQPCQLSGFDFYYQPTDAIIANPMYSNTLRIGEECALIRLTPDYLGVLDICAYYAAKLASMDGAVDMAITNSKLAYVLAAKSKSAAAALKTIFDKINSGDSTVIFDKKVVEALGSEEAFEFIDRQSIKNSYLVSDLLRDIQTIINQFDTEIGIPSLPTVEKKERMITDEAEAKNADTSARVSLWDESLSKSIKEVNDMFGLNISYEFVFLDRMNEEQTEDPADKKSLKEWGLE